MRIKPQPLSSGGWYSDECPEDVRCAMCQSCQVVVPREDVSSVASPPPLLAKMCDGFLRVYSFMSGLDLYPSDPQPPADDLTTPLRRRWCLQKYRVLILIRCLMIIMFVVSMSASAIRAYPRNDWSRPSVSDLFTIVFYVNHGALIALVVRLWRNQNGLRQVLGSHRNSIQHLDVTVFFAYLICWLYFILGDLLHSLSNSETTAQKIIVNICVFSGFHVRQIPYLMCCIYVQCQAIILRRLKRLDIMLTQATREYLRREKRFIRGMVSIVNVTFGLPVILMYTKIFAMLYVILVSNNIGETTSIQIFRLSAVALQVVVIYYMAYVGSAIIGVCRQTAFTISSQRLKGLSIVEQDYLRRLMNFDDAQDSLKISDCFTLTKGTFVSYLGAAITCVGVLLQFDYRLMAKFDFIKAHSTMES